MGGQLPPTFPKMVLGIFWKIIGEGVVANLQRNRGRDAPFMPLHFCNPCHAPCHQLYIVHKFLWPSGVSGQAVQPVPLAYLKLSMAVYGQKLDGRPSRWKTKIAHSAVLPKGHSTRFLMPRCGMHNRPKLAEKVRHNSLTQNKANKNNNNNNKD